MSINQIFIDSHHIDFRFDIMPVLGGQKKRLLWDSRFDIAMPFSICCTEIIALEIGIVPRSDKRAREPRHFKYRGRCRHDAIWRHNASFELGSVLPSRSADDAISSLRRRRRYSCCCLRLLMAYFRAPAERGRIARYVDDDAKIRPKTRQNRHSLIFSAAGRRYFHAIVSALK